MTFRLLSAHPQTCLALHLFRISLATPGSLHSRNIFLCLFSCSSLCLQYFSHLICLVSSCLSFKTHLKCNASMYSASLLFLLFFFSEVLTCRLFPCSYVLPWHLINVCMYQNTYWLPTLGVSWMTFGFGPCTWKTRRDWRKQEITRLQVAGLKARGLTY